MKNYTLIPEGITSLKYLAIWLGIKKVKNLVQILSDDVLIAKIGKLSTSLINLKELQKCKWCKNIDGKWVVNHKALQKEIRTLRKERILEKELIKPLEASQDTIALIPLFYNHAIFSPLGINARDRLPFGGNQ